MKKIVCILVSVIFITANSYGQGDITISWLTSETRTNAFGANSAATVSAFIEFNEEDIAFYYGKQLDTIKEVLFHIYETSLSYISSCKVIIMQGNDISTATTVTSQIVPVSDLVSNWNTVVLTNPCTVDSSKNLYIGYETSVTGTAYPLSVSDGTNPKQAWLYSDSEYFNLVDEGYSYTFMIKAIASTKASPSNEISLVSLDIKDYVMLGDSIQIKGKVKNLGSDILTSFTVSYEINNQVIDTETITGQNVNSGSEYTFTMTKYYVPTASEVLSVIKADVSNPNGVQDRESNNIQTTSFKLKVYNNLLTDRIVLHEVFTSSTCPPCSTGNLQLDGVLNTVDYNDWACIKYQYYFPSPGDPYYIAEGGVRGTFYGGINSVPTFFGDGTYAKNPGAYTVANFNTLQAIPAAATMSGTATHADKTIALNTTINVSTTNLTTNPDLRFFAAIVEKRTINNVKTNKETEFHYVLKKFMTDVNGDVLTGLTLNAAKQVNYTYTFKGNYRLPANAGSPINHATEHSVEIFENLMVVYWLQDIVTKEVYQAGKAEPYEGVIVSMKDINMQDVTLNVFPNPATDQLNINSSIPFAKVSLINVLGQTIKEVEVGAENHVLNVSDMAKGLYILKVDTPQGSTTKKIQIK